MAPNPDYAEFGQEYVDPGATVGGVDAISDADSVVDTSNNGAFYTCHLLNRYLLLTITREVEVRDTVDPKTPSMEQTRRLS